MTLLSHLARRAAVLVTFAAFSLASSQSTVTSPEKFFGHEIGADYQLPNYDALTKYWTLLAKESNRMKLVTIGKTAEGRDQLMAIVTSPENQARLEAIRETSRRLALGLDTQEALARSLVKDGKAVVWIDGGLHASEVLGAQQLMETLYRMVSKADTETLRILSDVVILFVHANPDGMQLISNWYMRNEDPLKRSLGGVPRLYQKYVGHDNNRDFYAVTQPESKNMNRVMYQEWYPQIMYNHHQTGPAGSVMFAPPFRDPFNFQIDPMVIAGLESVGAAMQTRFAQENKPGVVMRGASPYSAWWNGGLRTTAYFHNIVGILTETIGSPTPMRIPFVASRFVRNSDQPFPIEPQEWKFRQSIEYSVTANMAILDYASRYREQILLNIWKMARNSIQRGSSDTWTDTPTRVDAVSKARGTFADLRKPDDRDARGYIVPSDQPDFPTAVKFVNTLIENGVSVLRATSDFKIGSKSYPAGSLIVRCDQAFRPHVLDMFEPQDHPNDFQYPGGPPIPPYDSAGYTLAYQMGVKFDRILDGFEGPFAPVIGLAVAPPKNAPTTGIGWLIDCRINDSFRVVNDLLKMNVAVYRVRSEFEDLPAGSWFIPAAQGVKEKLQPLLQVTGVTARLAGGGPIDSRPVKALRIGLWDRYGGSMPSGWTRWIFEQFNFPFKVVFPKELDAGDLKSKFDVLVFVDGGIPGSLGQGGRTQEESVPEEFRAMLGSVSAKTMDQLKAFVEGGGTLVTIGSSSLALSRHWKLPITDALVETVDGQEKPLPRTKFYCPGSVLSARFDATHPAAWGMESRADVMFDDSPAFRLLPDAVQQGVVKVGWYDSDHPLRSGWCWGQQYLKDTVAAAVMSMGQGRVVLLGPEVMFRAQPHGTFKLVFNQLIGSGS